MASGKAKQDKSLYSMKKESQRLYRDVTGLEDALILHQRFQNEDENSVRGLIRKEIGGSIWQHGGTGKLQTYKSTRDLEDPYGLVNKNKGDRQKKSHKKKENSSEVDQNMNFREKFHNDPDSKVCAQESLDKQRKYEGYQKETGNGDLKLVKRTENGQEKTGVKMQKAKMKDDDNVMFPETNFGIYDEDVVAHLKTKVLERASTHIIKRKKLSSKPKENGKQEKGMGENKINKMLTYKVKDLHVDQTESGKIDKKKDMIYSNSKAVDKGRQSHLLSNKNNRKDVKQTNRIPSDIDKGWPSVPQNTSIKPANSHDLCLQKNESQDVGEKSKYVPQTFEQNSNSISRSLSDQSNDVVTNIKKLTDINVASLSEYKLQCDPDVHLWLRRLGLLEEEKYVKMFTENEIDMGILVELDEVQLTKMGVVALGAMKKLLAGIEELKSKNKAKELKQTDLLKQEVTKERYNTKLETDQKNSKSEPDTTAKTSISARSEHPTDPDNGAKSKVRTKEDINTATFVKRPNSSQSRTFTKVENCKQQFDNNQQKKNSIPGAKKRDGSLTRPSSAKSGSSSVIRVQGSKKIKDKQAKSVPRCKSAPSIQKKTVQDAKDSEIKTEENNKMKQEDESKAVKLSKKMKMNRDEMAARHLEREKKKREDNVEKVDTDTETLNTEVNTEVNQESKSDECLSELVGIKISTNTQTDQGIQVAEPVMKPPIKAEKRVRRPLYRPNAPRPMSRQSMALPTNSVEIQTDFTGKQPVVASHRSTSRPLSHYSYSSRKNTVRDLENQIEALQKKAMAGEEVTMDLVKDLQKRLEQIETQINDPDPSVVTVDRNNQLDVEVDDLSSKQKGDRQKTDVILQLQDSDDDTAGNSDQEEKFAVRKSMHYTKPMVSASMSKRELLHEIKKEKRHHRQQIKHLHSELSRIRNADPVKTVEIDRSEIDFDTDLIGEGSFSKVYHGLYQGSEVAIKQLKVPLTSQDKNYFAAEVSLLRDLRHPRVVLLMGVCTSEKLPIMVLEYMSNGSLYHLLHDQSRGPLDHAEYYRYAHDIALGMNFLHHHKPSVLHLDLKSMNVLICSLERAKIADFGFSKFRHDANIKANQSSKIKPVQGSPAWMAPEMLESGEITGKADVYSFAIILWEMFTRQQPYEGCSVFQVLERVRRNKRPELPSNCPEQLANFIKQSWDPLPSRRPSFKDVLYRLENMAFPPEWQALLKEAGVPPAALEDVHSTRTIISLVSSRLDMENVRTVMEDIQTSNDFHAPVESHITNKESARDNADSVKPDVNHIKVKIPIDDSVTNESCVTEETQQTKQNSTRNVRENKMSHSYEPESSQKSVNVSRDVSTRISIDVNTLMSQREKLKCSIDNELMDTINASTKTSQGDRMSEKADIRSVKEEKERQKPKNTLTPRDDKFMKQNVTKGGRKDAPKITGVESTHKSCEKETGSIKGMLELHLQEKVVNTSSPAESKKPKSRNVTPRSNPPSGRSLRGESLELKVKETVTEGIDLPCAGVGDIQSSTKNIKCSGSKSNIQDEKDQAKLDLKVDDNDLNDSLDIPEDIEVEEFNDYDNDSLDNESLKDSLNNKQGNAPFNVNTESQPFKFVTQNGIQRNGVDVLPNGQLHVITDQTDSKVSNKSGSIINELNLKFQNDDTKQIQPGPSSDKSASPAMFRTPRQSIEAWVDDEKDANRDSIGKTDKKRKISPSIPIIPPPILIPDNPPPPPPPPVIPTNLPLAPPLPSNDTGFLVVKASDLTKKSLKKVETTAKSPKESKSHLAVKGDNHQPFLLQSVELREQKEMLQSTSQPHPNQLQDLNNFSKGTIKSIAEILRQAVSSRRLALGEDNFSPSQSVTSSWSFMDD